MCRYLVEVQHGGQRPALQQRGPDQRDQLLQDVAAAQLAERRRVSHGQRGQEAQRHLGHVHVALRDERRQLGQDGVHHDGIPQQDVECRQCAELQGSLVLAQEGGEDGHGVGEHGPQVHLQRRAGDERERCGAGGQDRGDSGLFSHDPERLTAERTTNASLI
ncbi:hypothetical protein EYF80_049733 [Liparis tanakae]|uniref:Uncharacterized protein n=1 Tax=Liparis tanakae TaxID=230148 RepID=A0A4Z2FFW7_9TELE|nr:hypothetical protein EYF80_049733 [Liparis tanakae]